MLTKSDSLKTRWGHFDDPDGRLPLDRRFASTGYRAATVRADFISLALRVFMAEPDSATHTWPDLAIGLYDKLTGRNAEITYDFRDMDVHIPSSTGEDAKHAHWKLNGVLVIRTREVDSSGESGS